MNKPPIVLDWETHYSQDYSLRKMPVINYITDPRFESQCVSVYCPVLGINEPTCYYGDDMTSLMRNLKPIAHNLCLVGQNSIAFDALICLIHYGVQFGSHADTKIMARFALGSSQTVFSLEALAARFKLTAAPVYRQRVADALGMDISLLTDNKLSAALAAVKGKHLHEIPDNILLALGEYCNSDVQLTAELYRVLRPLFTAPAWTSMQSEASALLSLPLELDVARLRMVKDDYVTVRTAELDAFEACSPLAEPTGKEVLMPKAARMLKVIRSKPQFAALLMQLGVPKHDLPTKQGKSGRIYAFSKTDVALVELQAAYEDGESLVPEAIRLRLAYQSSQTEKRTEKFILAGQALANGRWAMHVECFGAVNTARHSGGNATGGSPHNLSRAKPTLHTSCGVDIRWQEDVGIRDCIMSPYGKVLVVYDSSGVELRCVGFITRETSITDALLDSSRDLYCEFGTSAFGRIITKADKTLRNAAKAGVLSLQYLTGYRRLFLTFQLWKLPLGIEVAQSAHTAYRATKPNVVLFWETLEKIMRHWCSLAPFPSDDPNVVYIDGTPRITGCPAIEIKWQGFKMPNGFELRYTDIKFKPGRGMGAGYSYWNANKRSRLRVHPGLVLENLSQSVTTQVIDWQKEQIRIELVGTSYQFCGDVHDEVLATCDPCDADKVEAVTEKWMKTSPPWWSQAIFGCEGGTGECLIEGDTVARQRYGAAK